MGSPVEARSDASESVNRMVVIRMASKFSERFRPELTNYFRCSAAVGSGSGCCFV